MHCLYCFFFFTDTATTAIYTLSLHDALPTSMPSVSGAAARIADSTARVSVTDDDGQPSQLPSMRSRTTPSSRSEEHTSELQSRLHLVCRLLLEKKKKKKPLVPSPLRHTSH